MTQEWIKFVETSDNTVAKRFRLTNERGKLMIYFEVENALHPHNWREEGVIEVLPGVEAQTYLALAGVRV